MNLQNLHSANAKYFAVLQHRHHSSWPTTRWSDHFATVPVSHGCRSRSLTPSSTVREPCLPFRTDWPEQIHRITLATMHFPAGMGQWSSLLFVAGIWGSRASIVQPQMQCDADVHPPHYQKKEGPRESNSWSPRHSLTLRNPFSTLITSPDIEVR